MRGISESEEKHIDNNVRKNFIDIFDSTLYVPNILLYGEVDINSSYDLDFIIEKSHLPMGMDNIAFPGKFNYDKDTIPLEDGKLMITDICSPDDWVLYNHYLLGRPKRIILYRENYANSYPIFVN